MRAQVRPERHGERRRVSVLFADLLGFSALSDRIGTEAAYLVVSQWLKALDGIARAHGGSVDKYLGDRLIAVFGHPVPVEHPSVAAVRSALEMREWLERTHAEAGLATRIGLHIGVNTGDVVAGDIRGAVVREFHVLGDAVNVAARLTAKAGDGEIFVGPATRAETGDAFEYRALEPLRLKGKSAPVPAFSLIGDRTSALLEGETAPSDAAPLVGRQDVLDRLRARAARLSEGKGAFVLLPGPEGIGKSRLLAEIAADPALAGLPRRHVCCPATAEPRQLATALSGLDSDAAGPGPAIVLVDDAHWLRGEALEALAALRDRVHGRPCLWVVALREDPPQAAARLRAAIRAGGGDDAEEIQLHPLAPGDAASLLNRLPSAAALDAASRDLVLARSAGNPGRIAVGVHLAPALSAEREHATRIESRSTESERRNMSVLFADITGFTALTERIGAERAYPIVATCLQLLDDVAKEHGGTVDHYLGDCVLALFGVPEALEDAPRSAINAAIEMRRRVRDFDREYALEPPLDVHSGIATGIGIAGDISGPLIREFAVMGDHVDRAYALTDLASAGEILVDGETRRQVQSVFEIESCPPVEAPAGRRLEPFRLRSNRVRLHRAKLGSERRVFSKLVGRSAELEEMRKRVGALARGEGGVISLLAEAGLGKSRLVAELRDSPEAQEVLWLEGRSISNGRNLSFHPFADLCRGWAGIGDEDDELQAIDRIARAVLDIMPPDEAEELLPFLKTLLGLPTSPAERERLEIVQGDMLERLVRRASVRLVTRMSEHRPLVMVLDDLHWADLSSIELFEGLLPLARDGLVLFLDVFRPGFSETSDRILSRVRAELADRHVEIALRPLDGGAARELVRNVFGSGDVPHATRRMIEEKARGNPFYIEEVVRALLDAGAVEWRGDALHATQSLDDFEIPSSVQDVIMARVDRLDLGRRRVLQIASVIGGSFHASILKPLCPSDQNLEDALDALLASEFIVPDDRGPGAEFAFKHPLIQEVTYGGLLEKNRRDLHLQVGEAIEVHMSADSPGIESMLAYHFTMGRDAQRAEVHLFRAGEEAARSAASGEALHFFREASRLYLDTHGEQADPGKRALLARNIARALFHRGQLIEAEASFNDAIGLLGQPVPRTQAALAARLASRLLPMGARLYLGDRLPLRRPASDKDREVVALMLERGMCEITANPTRFVLDSLDTLATALRVDPTTLPTATRVLAGASMIFAYGGISFGLSRRLLDMARERVEEADLQGAVMYGVTNFIHHVFEGDWSDRHELDEALLRQAIDHGLVWDALTYLGFHAERFIGRGEFENARRRIGLVRELWERFDHDLGRSTFHALSAYLALEEGRYEDAITATQTYYDENPEPLLHLLALGGKARSQVRLGRLDAAEATLKRCDTIIGELGRSQVPPYQRSFVLRAQAALDVARLEEAVVNRDARAVRARRRRARRTLRSARGVASLCALRRIEIWRLQGTLAWLEGSPKRATRRWQEALAEAERLGARPEAARTHLEIARRLGPEGPSVAGLGPGDHRQLALAGFRTLGLHPAELPPGWRYGESATIH